MRKLKTALMQFCTSHLDWIQSVSADYLKQKQVSLDVYIKDLCCLQGNLDELGILIISRCFHLHTLILVDGSYWTSRAENEYKDTLIKLAFCGDGVFKELSVLPKKDCLDVDAAINKADVLYKSNVEKSLQADLSDSGIITDPDSGHESDGEASKEDEENYFVVNGVKYPGIQKDYGDARKDFSDLTNVPMPSESEEEEPESSASSEDEGVQQDLWLPPSANHSRPRKTKKMAAPKSATNTAQATGLQPTRNAVKQVHSRCIERDQPYVCFYCQEVSIMQSSYRKHMETQHPNDLFPCESCNKMFKTFNNVCKHQRSHKYLKWGCKECDYRCQFPGQLTRHSEVHTQTDLVACTDPSCMKSFTDKYSMKAHLVMHTTQLICEYCPKSTNKTYTSVPALKQHIRGLHGPSWTAYCGEHFKWKSRYFKHLGKCLTCKAIKKQKKPRKILFLVNL